MLRLNKAVTLLAQTDKAVSAICQEIGYRDLSHFERTFKNCFEIAPSAYRSRCRDAVAPVHV